MELLESPSPQPSPSVGRGGFYIPSPLEGEGQDEGVFNKFLLPSVSTLRVPGPVTGPLVLNRD